MRRRRSSPSSMLAELGIASAETIARRVALMSTGRCTSREYRKMVTEKMAATGHSWLEAAFWPWTGMSALIEPWHRAARRNARRLRTKH